MRYSIFLAALIWFSTSAAQNYSDTTEVVNICNHINSSGAIKIVQPTLLTQKLTYIAPATGSSSSNNDSDSPVSASSSTRRAGYRVQVYSDNTPGSARQGALSCQARLAAAFPYLRTYVSFNSPYWSVKAGDFRTRAEAEAAMAEIKESLPSMAALIRIVRDKINVSD